MCKELYILRPQRKKKRKYPRRLAKRDEISSSNELWQMDIKYGYIHGQDKFFYQLSIIDVFDRSIVDYHLGLSCTAKDAVRTLKNALRKRDLFKGMDLPKIRTDNGPQFISNKFAKACKMLKMEHQRIPVKTPNMNAHIESFHSILERDCYSMNEFNSFIDVYRIVSGYMKYYNERYKHGSLNYMSPNQYYKAIKSNSIETKSFVA